MSADRKLPDVEMPDKQDPTLEVAVTGIRNRVIAIIFVIASIIIIAFAFFFWFEKERIFETLPRFEKAYVVSRLEGETVASDEDKTILDGRGVMLYALVYGFDTVDQKYYYYMDPPEVELPRVRLKGHDIPVSQVKRYKFYDVLSFVHWYKIEPSSRFLVDTTLTNANRIYWTMSRKHRMGTNWWAIADVRSDLTRYHYDFSGTMRYTINLQIFDSENTNNVFADLSTDNSVENAYGKIPPGALRITRISTYRSGLDAAYRAFFNLPVFQDREGLEDAAIATQRFEGGDSRSILIGALRLMGNSVDYDDPLFLEKVADKVFDKVDILLAGKTMFFQTTDPERKVILFGQDGVKNGDILVRGNRYTVLVQNADSDVEPEGGALTGDDLILDAWNGLVRPAYVSVMSGEKGTLQIWRLKKNEFTGSKKANP